MISLASGAARWLKSLTQVDVSSATNFGSVVDWTVEFMDPTMDSGEHCGAGGLSRNWRHNTMNRNELYELQL